MSKTFSLASVAALVAATLFAEMPMRNQASNPCACLEQGMGLPSNQKCYSAAYNAPASISVRNGWDFNFFASFIYWHVSQSGMEVASFPSTANAAPASVVKGGAYQPDFKYKPGFKVGFGFDTNYDDWTGFVEYTWMHQTTTNTSTNTLFTANSIDAWNAGLVSYDAFTTVSSKWKMNLDMLDAAFSRPFYQGTQLTVAPYAGMRGLWIRERLNLTMNDTVRPLNINSQYSQNQSHSWAVGPMMGTRGHWLLGAGFRFDGDANAALLYTQYTKIANRQQRLTDNVSATSTTINTFHDLNELRAMAGMGVGLGWGSYLDGQNYYFDLSARYDFNILWDQNVMARFVNVMNHTNGTSGDLYLHGLTLSARFDF